jgi:uncharacterized protein YjeT (DUF2065 family)
LLYLAVSAALMWAALQVQLEEAFWGLVTVAAGVPVYYLLRRRRTAAGT